MLAFGGGQAGLPLTERLAFGETGWSTLAQFAAGVGLSYAAAIGLLGVTVVALVRPVLAINRRWRSGRPSSWRPSGWAPSRSS